MTPVATARSAEGRPTSLPDSSDLQELLRGASDRVGSVYAELREWSHPARTMAAWARHALGGEEATSLAGTVPTDPYEVVSRCWVAPPERFREEGPDHLIVQVGDRWYSRHPATGVETNDDDPDRTITVANTLRHWIDPASILPLVRLSVEGESSVAGRSAVRARALPTVGAGDDPGLDWLGYGADEWELLVDRERGVLLGTAARLEGEPFRVGEALRITFDEAFDESLFALPT